MRPTPKGARKRRPGTASRRREHGPTAADGDDTGRPGRRARNGDDDEAQPRPPADDGDNVPPADKRP